MLAAAAANRDIDSVADEIGEPLRRRHAHVDIAVRAAEPGQTGISQRAANESIVLTLTMEVCPVAADVAALRCSSTSRISVAKDAPAGVNCTERLARIISCTPR